MWASALAHAPVVALIGVSALLDPLLIGFKTGLPLALGLPVYGVVAITAGVSPGRRRWVEALRRAGIVERIDGSDGATWLDRRLIHSGIADLAPAGFGQQVREAMDQRREHHVEQGDATQARDGRIFYRRNLLQAADCPPWVT